MEQMSTLASLQLLKSRIVDYAHLNEHDPDLDSDLDDSACEQDRDISENDTDSDVSINGDDDEYLDDLLFHINSTDFRGMPVYDSINPALAESYFIINIKGKQKYLHKRAALGFFQRTSLICRQIVWSVLWLTNKIYFICDFSYLNLIICLERVKPICRKQT